MNEGASTLHIRLEALRRHVERLGRADALTGVGVDHVRLDRVGQSVSARALLEQIAPDTERSSYTGDSGVSRTVVARLVAVKEAAAKAAGTGIRPDRGWSSWVPEALGESPFAVATPEGLELEIYATCTTADGYALAVAVALSRKPSIG